MKAVWRCVPTKPRHFHHISNPNNRHVRLKKNFVNRETIPHVGVKLRIPEVLLVEKMRTQQRFNVSVPPALGTRFLYINTHLFNRSCARHPTAGRTKQSSASAWTRCSTRSSSRRPRRPRASPTSPSRRTSRSSPSSTSSSATVRGGARTRGGCSRRSGGCWVKHLLSTLKRLS